MRSLTKDERHSIYEFYMSELEKNSVLMHPDSKIKKQECIIQYLAGMVRDWLIRYNETQSDDKHKGNNSNRR